MGTLASLAKLSVVSCQLSDQVEAAVVSLEQFDTLGNFSIG